MAIERDALIQRRVPWGAIWAGLFVLIGVEVVLQIFGAAIGLSAMGPQGEAARGAGIWMIIWAFISTFSAYFFGGWVTGHYSGLRRHSTAGSIVLWGFATAIFFLVVSSGMLGSVGASLTAVQKNLPSGAAGNALPFLTALGVGLSWGMFFTLVVSLILCIVGGVVGSRQRHERDLGAPVPPLVEREV